MSNINAMVGVDFSLIGTKLHAAYEKVPNGFSVLLMPTKQEADNGVSIGQAIKDIQKMIESKDSNASTREMEADLTGQLKNCSNGSDKDFSLDKIIVKLNMAYLYIKKTDKKEGDDKSSEDVLEYAFQLEILSDGFIPDAVKQIVDVTRLSIAIWQTDRKKVLEKMQLVTINDYLENAHNSEAQKLENKGDSGNSDGNGS